MLITALYFTNHMVKSFFVNQNSKQEIISCGLEIVRAGGTISFDTVSEAAGISKPGLMYHFATKKALMLALVDAAADLLFSELESRLSSPSANASIDERVLVYFETCLEREADPSDITMFTDPRLRTELTVRWNEKIEPWFEGIDTEPAERRARLKAVRNMADGFWFNSATTKINVSKDEAAVIHNLAKEILAGS